MDDLLAEFLTETWDRLGFLDSAVIRLERTPGDAAALAEVFRILHTIKGTCGFLGLTRMEAVAHAGESVLGQYRDGGLKISQGNISLVLAALDCIRGIVAGLAATGAEPVGDDAALLAALAVAGRAAPVFTPDPVADAPGARDAPAQSIRVAVEVVEELTVLVSELARLRNQMLQLSRNGAGSTFTLPLQRLSHITAKLQKGVMNARVRPVGDAWARLPRLARDLGVELGKRIELRLQGAGVGLDRQVVDLIKDPLAHMVRNAADHGLETPGQRVAAGKPDTGRIMLNAAKKGGHIILEIADDGRGLNLQRIRAAALARGLATEAELARMPEREVMRFIFRASFSTAVAVTAVSGRGVGLDVVRSNIERIGGTIEVRSEEGRGTAFVIRIPQPPAAVCMPRMLPKQAPYSNATKKLPVLTDRLVPDGRCAGRRQGPVALAG